MYHFFPSLVRCCSLCSWSLVDDSRDSTPMCRGASKHDFCDLFDVLIVNTTKQFDRVNSLANFSTEFSSVGATMWCGVPLLDLGKRERSERDRDCGSTNKQPTWEIFQLKDNEMKMLSNYLVFLARYRHSENGFTSNELEILLSIINPCYI